MELYAGLIEFNWTLVFMWLTLITLYFVMKHFFFEKVHNFMEKRKNQIKEAFDNAEIANASAEEKLQDYQRRISDVESEAKEIIRQARVDADSQAKIILDESNDKIMQMRAQAEKEIEEEKHKAIAEMREEILGLAIMAAQKVLEQEIEVSGQDDFMDKLIQEVEGTSWQN